MLIDRSGAPRATAAGAVLRPYARRLLALLDDALTILAAGGTAPDAVARGHRAFRELLEQMNEARISRLVTAGLSAERAARLSALHTPNFM